MRCKLQDMAHCPAESRYWLATHATDHLLLTRAIDANAARVLRLSGSESDKTNEDVVSADLLLLEIANLDVRRQLDYAIQAGLDFVPLEFRDVLRRPDADDIDQLVDRYRDGSPKQQRLLLLLLSLRPVELNVKARGWIHESARSTEDTEARVAAFGILSSADRLQFGRTLFSDGWSWSLTEHVLVNHIGTDALIKATSNRPFNQFASRLAPWRLIEAARRRGCRPTEVQLAADLFGRVLMDSTLDLQDPEADLSVDRSLREVLPFAYSVAPQPTHSEGTIRWPTVDAEEQLQTLRATVDAANTHIQDAWRSGASLYLIDVHVKDFLAVLKHAPDAIDQWLSGLSEPTEEFTRRVRLAEGAFLGLCEALMEHDPDRGTALWWALQSTLTTKYFGPGGVNEFVHMAFRVPDSPAVTALRS